jgi:hypothetical protein
MLFVANRSVSAIIGESHFIFKFRNINKRKKGIYPRINAFQLFIIID